MSHERKALAWIGIFAAFLLFVWVFSDILLPFVTGLIIAYFLDPVADRLCRAGLSRLLATAIIMVLLVVVSVMFVLFVAPLIINQVRELVVDIPGQLAELSAFLERVAREWLGERFPDFQDELKRAIGELSRDWASTAGGLVQSVWSGSLALVNFVSLVLVTPVVAFYLLLDWDIMIAKVDSWLPRANAPTIRRLGHEVNQVIAGFLRGQGTVALLLGLFYAIGLTWIGLKYGLLIGLISGLLSFIPFVGSISGLLLSSGVALSQFWGEWWSIGGVVAIFVLGQLVEGNVLQPKIVGDSIRLHPVWMIFALFAFTYLFGLVGALIAIPVSAAIGVLARFVVGEYRQSDLYRGGGDGDGEGDGIPGAPERKSVA